MKDRLAWARRELPRWTVTYTPGKEPLAWKAVWKGPDPIVVQADRAEILVDLCASSRTYGEAKRDRRKGTTGNIPSLRVALLGNITALEYIHSADGQRYRHDHSRKRPKAQVYYERDGDCLIIHPVKVKGGFIQ